MNKSPLRYPGGKTRACKILDETYNRYFDNNEFISIISPFFGGGSFEFHMQNKYQKEVYANDMFVPLFTFWSTCKCKKIELVEALEKRLNNVTKETFQELQSNIMKCDNPLTQAIDYFTINRCSFSGATLSGGFSNSASTTRFTKSSINKISLLNLEQFNFYNDDFEIFIKNHYNNQSFMFLDPPYYLDNTLYGKNGNMHNNFDHERLFQVIREKKWMMTYNDCDYIRNMYKDYTIIEASWSYGMNESKKSSEIIIISN